MFHYFLKVVSTQFRTLDGETVNSHQYSVTHFERDLETGAAGSTNEGIQLAHGINGLPGERQFSPLAGFSQCRHVINFITAHSNPKCEVILTITFLY